MWSLVMVRLGVPCIMSWYLPDGDLLEPKKSPFVFITNHPPATAEAPFLEVAARWCFGRKEQDVLKNLVTPTVRKNPVVEGFNLPSSSAQPVILDVGGNHGWDLEQFIARFRPGQTIDLTDGVLKKTKFTDQRSRPVHVFSFEANPRLADSLREKPEVLANKDFVHILPEAVGEKTGNMTLHVDRGPEDEAASQFTDTKSEPGYDPTLKASIVRSAAETVPVRGVGDVFSNIATTLKAPPKTLGYAVSVNCEGCEYEILGALLNTSEVYNKQVKYVGVSWHLLSPEKTHDARVKKRCDLERGLSAAGFRKTYNSYFGWQGWELVQ